MDALSKSLADLLSAYPRSVKIYVALSGGVDSSVLLHVASKLSPRVTAIHVNHGLHVQAKQWEMHCAVIATQLHVPLLVEHITDIPKVDIENQLRQQRYALFEKYIDNHSILLTAHHQEDQAETVLLQLLRGAGPKGLSAMPFVKSFAAGSHVRPFLSHTRADILGYATKNHISWIEDDSNLNQNFTRNFLRHEILPTLKKRWPTISATLARTALHCAHTEKLLSEYVQQDLNQCVGTVAGTLSVEKLMQFDDVRRQAILRAWMMQHRFILPPQKKLQQMTQSVITAGVDRQPHLSWGDVEVRRYRDDLYIMKQLPAHDAAQVVACSEKNKTIRFRQGGEKIQLPGRSHHSSLKKILQEKGIPPWLRDRIPLVYEGDELVALIIPAFAH